MAVWSEATAPSCYDHTFAMAFQPLHIYMSVFVGGGGGGIGGLWGTNSFFAEIGSVRKNIIPYGGGGGMCILSEKCVKRAF